MVHIVYGHFRLVGLGNLLSMRAVRVAVTCMCIRVRMRVAVTRAVRTYSSDGSGWQVGNAM